jgi:hypothetical protein
MKRAAALLLLGLALTLPASAFAASGSYAGAKLEPQRTRSSLLANGSFEAGPSGFTGYRATLALIGGAAEGARAVRVSLAGSRTSYSILPTPKPVASTLAGASYSASVLVRSQTPGRQLCLRLREYAGGSVVGSAMQCLIATSAWQTLERLSYKALASGHQLDVYVFQLQAKPGDSFDLDALRLSSGAGTPVPPPPPPAPLPPPASGLHATTIDHAHIELTWAPVADAARYRLLRGTLLVGQTSGLSFTDTLLWPQSRYDYRLEALSETGALLQAQEASAQTALLPAAGFPRPFPATSIWNQPVGQTAPHPNSAGLSAYLVANARNPNLTLHNFAVSVAEAHPSDPTYSVPCTRYARCTLGAFGSFSIPLTAQADLSADGHLAVYDPRTQREWDFWQGLSFDSAWSASAGAAVSMEGDGTAPQHTASGNAANFPLLGGLIRPEELLQGEIAHALVFMMPNVSALGHVCPATHHAGAIADPNALMEGMRIQLDPALNVEALPLADWQKTIARALQRYGAYLRDGSGSLAILAENPRSRGYDAWAKVGLAGNSVSLSALPWNRVRVLQPPATGC